MAINRKTNRIDFDNKTMMVDGRELPIVYKVALKGETEQQEVERLKRQLKTLTNEVRELRELLKPYGINVTDKAIEYSRDITPDGSFLHSKRTGRTLPQQVRTDLAG